MIFIHQVKFFQGSGMSSLQYLFGIGCSFLINKRFECLKAKCPTDVFKSLKDFSMPLSKMIKPTIKGIGIPEG